MESNTFSNVSSAPNSQQENGGLVNDRNTYSTNNEENVNEESSHFERKKIPKTSPVWEDFTEVKMSDGTKKAQCRFCKSRLAILSSSSTSHSGLHLKTCAPKATHDLKQQKIIFQAVDLGCNQAQHVTLTLTDGKFDMMKIRECNIRFQEQKRAQKEEIKES